MRPSGLTAICVIGLCLAGLGATTLAGGIFGLLAQPAINQFNLNMQKDMPPEFKQAQQDMQRDILAVQQKWAPALAGIAVFNLVTVLLLAAGCILGLKLHPKAFRWLMIALVCGLVFELARLVPGIGMQQETQAVIGRYMERFMMAGPKGAPAEARQMMQTMMQVGAGIGLAITVGWAALLIGFYGWSIWYLQQPDVKKLFEEALPVIELNDGPEATGA